MELEELKNAWDALDTQLKESKSLKTAIILNMIHSKTNKTVNRLLNWEVIGAVVVILLIPFIAYMYYTRKGDFIMWDTLMIIAAIICITLSFWQPYKVFTLLKIDFSKEICKNIYNVNRYNIAIKRERNLTNFFFGPVFAILLILTYMERNVSAYLWIFLICVLVLTTLLMTWLYKKYNKNISSILKSLEEIKELEEQEE